MFLKNSRWQLVSEATQYHCVASILPKLLLHFAEFPKDSNFVALAYSARAPVSVLVRSTSACAFHGPWDWITIIATLSCRSRHNNTSCIYGTAAARRRYAFIPWLHNMLVTMLHGFHRQQKSIARRFWCWNINQLVLFDFSS
jgi:hypothetical protein